jgi:NAD(P)-dependent dehydrogenase (short-subunit alcohol dehydrogenase family)
MSENRKLTGKVAIVFGGSRGIGAAAARRLAREGANVGLTYVSAPDKAADTVRAIEEQGRTGSMRSLSAWRTEVRLPSISHGNRRVLADLSGCGFGFAAWILYVAWWNAVWGSLSFQKRQIICARHLDALPVHARRLVEHLAGTTRTDL